MAANPDQTLPLRLLPSPDVVAAGECERLQVLPVLYLYVPSVPQQLHRDEVQVRGGREVEGILGQVTHTAVHLQENRD